MVEGKRLARRLVETTGKYHAEKAMTKIWIELLRLKFGVDSEGIYLDIGKKAGILVTKGDKRHEVSVEDYYEFIKAYKEALEYVIEAVEEELVWVKSRVEDSEKLLGDM